MWTQEGLKFEDVLGKMINLGHSANIIPMQGKIKRPHTNVVFIMVLLFLDLFSYLSGVYSMERITCSLLYK